MEGRKAVVEVILNRVLSDSWPDTIEDVLKQKGQFAGDGRGVIEMDGKFYKSPGEFWETRHKSELKKRVNGNDL